MAVSKLKAIVLATAAIVGMVVTGLIYWNQDTEAQHRRLSCGSIAVFALCEHYGLPVTLEEVDQRCNPSSSGETNLAILQIASREFGLSTEGRMMSIDTLEREKPLGVLHVNDDHFVAALGYESNGDIDIADSDYSGSLQIRPMSASHLSELWDGVILVVKRVRHTEKADSTAMSNH